MERPEAYAARPSFAAKVKEFVALFKLRLTSLVVFSAVLGYLFGVREGEFQWSAVGLLALAGTLVTGASNALNQVLEVNADSLMKRTAGRPLVREALSTGEAIAAATVAGVVGIVLLWTVFGPLTGILGFLSLFLYVGLYTPLKGISPWAVLVGAFPGAFPPMLGNVAATGAFGLGPGLLFATQFMWQFPHFWAIAWVLHEDYQRAGYHLLPSRGGQDRFSAFLILLYTLFVIPVSVLPWVFGLTGPWSAVAAVLLGALMVVPAFRLYRSLDKADARKLMFASFIHLPLLQLAYVLDRL